MFLRSTSSKISVLFVEQLTPAKEFVTIIAFVCSASVPQVNVTVHSIHFDTVP